MKVFELLYIFSKYRNQSIVKFPKSAPFIIKSYIAVSKKIRDMYDVNKVITTANIQKLDITEHMKNKLQFLLTQTIPSNEIKKLYEKKLIDNLMDIAGIGKTKATTLVNSGLTKVSDLNKKKYREQLNDATKLLLKYNPERKIAHDDIKKIEKKLTGFPSAQIVGGFRRKKPFSKDIDVMIVSKDAKKSSYKMLDDILYKYITYLKKKFKDVYVYSQGGDKASLLILVDSTINTQKSVYYKVDVFKCPNKHKHAMLLYSTGSKEFNVRMRANASRQGYLLNQNGLYKKNNGVVAPTPVPVKSEKDFFKILNIPYIIPKKR